MSDATLRAGIKTLVLTVPGAGKIHDYERWVTDQAKFIDLFKDASGRIMGWEITRSSIGRVERLGGRFKVTAEYRLKGYYCLKDSEGTEKAFNVIVDAIVLTLLSNQVAGSEKVSLPRVENIGARVFGQVLCHYAEIVLDLTEIVTPTSAEELVDLLAVGVNYYLKPGDETSDAADEINLDQ